MYIFIYLFVNMFKCDIKITLKAFDFFLIFCTNRKELVFAYWLQIETASNCTSRERVQEHVKSK